jgi:hypothetical protein
MPDWYRTHNCLRTLLPQYLRGDGGFAETGGTDARDH